MKNVLLIFLAAATVCCGGGGTKTGTKDTAEKKIEMPAIPDSLQTEVGRAMYLAKHYWDKFDFADTSYIDKPELTEQAFSNYVNLLSMMPERISRPSVNDVFTKAEADSAMYRYFVELSEKYLHDPNSPMRNEDLYIMVLNNILASDKLSDVERIRPEAHLRMAVKNRVGQKANDFRYTLASGAQHKLYDLKAEYTLLYINNPDCNACAALTSDIQASELLRTMIDNGTLKVLAVYPDEDLTAWQNHRKEMPAAWINAYDKERMVRSEKLYDLQAIPTIYLLDKDKTVLLKDVANVQPLERYFGQLLNSGGMTMQ